MGLKERIIKRLEKDVEYTAGTIDLESLDEEKRENLFKQFGEGDKNLTEFLKTTYKHGAPSIFCCSGHGYQAAYVCLKVTDENLEMLRNLGKVLSNYRVSTNFTDDHVRGKYMSLHGLSDNISTEWLHIASKVLETPELYDSSKPSIYYHQEIYPSYKPFGFDLKKKLLKYLRGDKKQLPEGKNISTTKEESKWWDLSEEEKANIKPIDSKILNQTHETERDSGEQK